MADRSSFLKAAADVKEAFEKGLPSQDPDPETVSKIQKALTEKRLEDALSLLKTKFEDNTKTTTPISLPLCNVFRKFLVQWYESVPSSHKKNGLIVDSNSCFSSPSLPLKWSPSLGPEMHAVVFTVAHPFVFLHALMALWSDPSRSDPPDTDTKKALAKAGAGRVLTAGLHDAKMLNFGTVKSSRSPFHAAIEHKATNVMLDVLGSLAPYLAEDAEFVQEVPALLDCLQRIESVWGIRLQNCLVKNQQDQGVQVLGLLKAISCVYCNLSTDRELRRAVLRHAYTMAQLKRILSVDPMSFRAAGRFWAMPFTSERQVHAAGCLSNLAVVHGNSRGSASGKQAHLRLLDLGAIETALEVAGRLTCLPAVRETCCQIISWCVLHPTVANAVVARDDWMALLSVISVHTGMDDEAQDVFHIRAASLAIMRAIQCADPPPTLYETPKPPPAEDGENGSAPSPPPPRLSPFPVPVSVPFKRRFVEKVLGEASRLRVLPGKVGWMLKQMGCLPIKREEEEKETGDPAATPPEGASGEGEGTENSGHPSRPHPNGCLEEVRPRCGHCGKEERPQSVMTEETAEGVRGFVEKLMACNSCMKELYCSRVCQRADWKVHKPVCKSLRLSNGEENQPEGANVPCDAAAAAGDAASAVFENAVEMHN
uniref:MYND-type domain-containing protein n=1 Tax=Chromera velia CCMP2878 TaxID=1169474 RepID=A0A0G4I3S1_9ALVE|eukprot:Cvel_10671.t1-p1 / transcript=Cvel_10671.t1 / gene=Cvel_10671 / organism=Chromera_velia_CCMP2878 / gene_product=hypothetical protein / transcript_product=hypothetical protein / location=Cvel_scaffold649:323-2281(-) / protein_length=653 / sequence_SO=supercontig / SO=protein_coding / is_pseudo=false